MSQLDSLYQDIILDHYKNPVGAGLREPYAVEVHHVNPTCGDEITLRLTLEGDGDDRRVADVSYDAEGCSISQAGASVAHEQLVGRPVPAALESLAGFKALMQSKGRPETEPDEDLLGDGVAFVGVAKFPGRVKCALLAWMAFEDALHQSNQT
ncbi:SUF system NifU family Fe-S cluster assembly protein [Nocardioidaceae bacterium]|nr:SUF system NifU family Fe-S cluster assembly protein [Nocardioidaceae bacterium]